MAAGYSANVRALNLFSHNSPKNLKSFFGIGGGYKTRDEGRGKNFKDKIPPGLRRS